MGVLDELFISYGVKRLKVIVYVFGDEIFYERWYVDGLLNELEGVV